MEDEAEGNENDEKVHLEIKLKIDDVRQYDEVDYFILEFVCNFLYDSRITMTYPSIV